MGDVGQVVEGSEEEEAGDAVGDSRGGGGGDAGADRFAKEDDGGYGRDGVDGFPGGGEEGFLRGAAGTCALAGVFEDVEGDGVVRGGGAE